MEPPEASIGSTLDSMTPSSVHDVPLSNDPLAGALHYLRMDGMFYCRSELSAPWGLELPPMPDCLWFHVVTRGACTLIDSSDVVHQLNTGDIALLPHGAGHRAVDTVGSATPLVFDLPHHYVSRQYALLRHGGGGERAEVVCGVVQLGHPVARSLLAVLPEVIHVDGSVHGEEWPWLSPLLALMAAETREARPGGETVVTRLCDVLVIRAIRFWIETEPAANIGWLGALRDPTIGRAIVAVHADPSRDWTVTSLAAEVGMSRSGFSARFSELVGASPKQYVTQWRMRMAEDMLRGDGDSILTIARQLGYQSEAAFSRAFKRETGSAPSHVRRRADLVEIAQTLKT